MMGLLDVLNGMQNGPRGQRDPNQSSGGMSPITMAILALLAYKAVKHIGGAPSRARNYRKRDLRLRRPYQEQQLQALAAALPVVFLVG